MDKKLIKQEDGSYKLIDDPDALKRKGCGCWIALIISVIIMAIYFYFKIKYGIKLW